METLSISRNNRRFVPSNEGFGGLLNVQMEFAKADGTALRERHTHLCSSLRNKVQALEIGFSVSKVVSGRTNQLPIRHIRSKKCWSSVLVASTNAPEGSSPYIKQDESVYLGQPTSKEELAAIRESAMRTRLMRRLSDANLYGRHIQRQLLEKEAALLKCKRELATMETEIKNLLHLAQEVASEGPRPGSRKINGKYIQSHFTMKLKELYECVARQVEDIDTVCYRDVPLVWYGMAEYNAFTKKKEKVGKLSVQEDVQVMGSFDGWSQGQPMSPEASSYFTKFSTTLKLRPGRYQIKFMVDGEWKLSPDLAQVGEGMIINNLLVVT